MPRQVCEGRATAGGKRIAKIQTPGCRTFSRKEFETRREEERTDADGHGRKAHRAAKTDWRTTHGAAHRTARGSESVSHRADSIRHGGGIFETGARTAADSANAEARAGSFDTHEDGQRAGESPHGVSRATQYLARAGERRDQVSPERDAG